MYADLEVISSDQFSASDLLRLTAASLLITHTSAVIAAQPWDILSTAVRLWPQTVRRQEAAGMVLFGIRRVRSARLDGKRWCHRREISIRPQRSDPSELLLKDHNATPRKSMLRGADFGHNIYRPIPQSLKRAQGSMENSNSIRISLVLTHGYPTIVERDSIG